MVMTMTWGVKKRQISVQFCCV